MALAGLFCGVPGTDDHREHANRGLELQQRVGVSAAWAVHEKHATVKKLQKIEFLSFRNDK